MSEIFAAPLHMIENEELTEVTERIALNSGDIQYETYVEGNKGNKGNENKILHPHGPFRIIWDILIIIIVIYTCIEVPFTLAFNITLTLSMTMGIVALLIDCLLLIDIGIIFRTAYYDKYNPFELIKSPKEIAKKYISSWFVLDVFTSIPFEFLFPQTENNEIITTRLIKLLRIFRLLRLFKLLRFFRMMKIFNNFLRYILSQYSIVIILKLLRIISSMMLITHYIACLWWFIGTYSLIYYDDSWNIDLLNESIYISYAKSWYFSVTTLFTVGYNGNFVPHNTIEEIICSIIILFGTCFFAIIIGAISNLISQNNNMQKIQTKKIEQAQWLCVSKKLPLSLSIEIMTHLKYYINNNLDTISENDNIINYLPIQIQSLITKHCDKTFFIDKLPIFKDLNSNIRGHLALKLKSINFNSNKYLFKQFDKPSIFIQRTGESIITSSNINIQSQNCQSHILTNNSVFGYFSFLNNYHISNVKTLSYSEFYYLDINDILNIVNKKQWENIKKQIQILYKNKQIKIQISNNTFLNNTINYSKFHQLFNINQNDSIRNEKIKNINQKIKGNINYKKEILLMQKETNNECILINNNNDNNNNNNNVIINEEDTKINDKKNNKTNDKIQLTQYKHNINQTQQSQPIENKKQINKKQITLTVPKQQQKKKKKRK
eukprot:545117_1